MDCWSNKTKYLRCQCSGKLTFNKLNNSLRNTENVIQYGNNIKIMFNFIFLVSNILLGNGRGPENNKVHSAPKPYQNLVYLFFNVTWPFPVCYMTHCTMGQDDSQKWNIWSSSQLLYPGYPSSTSLPLGEAEWDRLLSEGPHQIAGSSICHSYMRLFTCTDFE